MRTGKTAELYLHGEVVQGELIGIDSKTYIAPVLTFLLTTGQFKGEKIAIFENGEKFRNWL